MDTILCHPREIFRLAVMASAAAIIIAHNHPSGDPTPSEADIKITRDLIRAGQLLKIEFSITSFSDIQTTSVFEILAIVPCN
jgi:DNA repair protein RadC